MLALSDNISQSIAAMKAHKLRAALTVIGLMMGVATLITVMTIVQGANVYVEQKIANLGTNVFQIARTPFAVTDFNLVIKALKNKHISLEDLRAVQQQCSSCKEVGATANSTTRVKWQDRDLQDVNLYGHTSNMSDIDTRTVLLGRYFTDVEDQHNAAVCLIGDTIIQQFFPGTNPVGKQIRLGNDEFTVIGTFEKIGSVLGQDSDNFVVVPLQTYLRMRGARFSLTLNIMSPPGAQPFERAQDQARVILRARRHILP